MIIVVATRFLLLFSEEGEEELSLLPRPKGFFCWSCWERVLVVAEVEGSIAGRMALPLVAAAAVEALMIYMELRKNNKY